MATRRHGNDDPRGGGKKKSGMTARLQYGRSRNPEAQADWSTASPTTIQALIDTVTQQGGAVLFGYSRDRGSYRILIYDDDGNAPVWIPCTTDIDEALQGLIDELWTNPDAAA